ncbi:arylsulfatase J-like [Ptychodera flava]|uniref:arylsulfatase J-like n=1 Tax=Ptychodera flava TaxID=63121 RepID=UPI00396A52D7
MNKLLVIVSVCLVTCGHSDAQTNQPNIVFIMVDDLGWADVGYNNPYIISPTIDGLARDGVIFNQAYVHPACTPTRGSFMTGYFAHRTGLQHDVLNRHWPTGLPLNFTTLPEKLQEEGYTTYMVGKWHLGYCNYDYTPNGRGFDHFYGYYSGTHDYFNHTVGQNHLDLREDLVPDRDQKGVYSTYLFGEKAAEYVANHDNSKPLFMFFSTQSVHLPLQVPDFYLNKYEFVKNDNRRKLMAMVTALDDSIATVVKALKEHGLWDNTLLIFQSDNGGSSKDDHMSINWPLRGGKKTLWEGGNRVVTFAHGNMLENVSYVNEEMIHVVDWFPTLVKLAGGNTDPDMDGVDVWDTIAKGDPSPRTEFVYNIDVWQDDRSEAIRVGDYKLIKGRIRHPSNWVPPPESYCSGDEFEKGQVWGIVELLYNIKDDPTEHNDLSEEMPEKVAELAARLDAHRLKVVQPIQGTPNYAVSSPDNFCGVYSPGWC